jgi:hypothetical protein
MSYTPINWEDFPSKATPLNAKNLKHMDEGIEQNAEDIDDIKEEVSSLNSSLTSIFKISTLKITPQKIEAGGTVMEVFSDQTYPTGYTPVCVKAFYLGGVGGLIVQFDRLNLNDTRAFITNTLSTSANILDTNFITILCVKTEYIN